MDNRNFHELVISLNFFRFTTSKNLYLSADKCSSLSHTAQLQKSQLSPSLGGLSSERLDRENYCLVLSVVIPGVD